MMNENMLVCLDKSDDGLLECFYGAKNLFHKNAESRPSTRVRFPPTEEEKIVKTVFAAKKTALDSIIKILSLKEEEEELLSLYPSRPPTFFLLQAFSVPGFTKYNYIYKKYYYYI
jgi:hypothetical protein